MQALYRSLIKKYISFFFRRSKNAMGPVQSKWRPKYVMLTLHGTHYVYTSMNLTMKFSFYIFIFTTVLCIIFELFM